MSVGGRVGYHTSQVGYEHVHNVRLPNHLCVNYRAQPLSNLVLKERKQLVSDRSLVLLQKVHVLNPLNFSLRMFRLSCNYHKVHSFVKEYVILFCSTWKLSQLTYM